MSDNGFGVDISMDLLGVYQLIIAFRVKLESPIAA